MTLVLTVTLELGGDQAPAAAAKVAELLPDHNGLVASGFASVLVRRLVACGLAAGHPDGWRFEGVEVRNAATD